MKEKQEENKTKILFSRTEEYYRLKERKKGVKKDGDEGRRRQKTWVNGREKFQEMESYKEENEGWKKERRAQE